MSPRRTANAKAKGKRNPPWSRDELILALDLYLKSPKSPLGKDSKEVTELSDFLSRMANARGVANAEKFRNANGVYMNAAELHRICNIASSIGKQKSLTGNFGMLTAHRCGKSDELGMVVQFNCTYISRLDGHK